MSILDDIKKLHAFQDLLLIYVWRELSIRYKHTVLGIVWAVIQPLCMMGLFTVVFTVIMPTKVSSYPYPVFFYTALISWNFFASSLQTAIPCLAENYNLVTKIYFPREILPLSGAGLAFIDFLIAGLLLVPLYLYFGITFTWQMLYVIPLALLLILFTISTCLVFSAMNVYYRDVKLLMNFLVQLWFFATPVIYSLDAAPMGLKLALLCNPLTFIIENMRRCLLEGRGVILWQLAVMAVLVGGYAVCSYRVFKITEKKFADVI
ncbi:ABC transporter permease [Geobacter benzoatilyticus]|uniref:Transport permease protein n=1 Tax=Geobacter benzoatilyticus TaxID=2815309 RepID=A0ABX7Q1J1_9BACT|nr:ABC transporter permease [Geobacter benzoatilyticus]QSV44935.1 ABC transporter permease [Geobacter benzoatilyticus]